MGRREELLRAEAERWAEFVAALEAVPADRLDTPGLNAEGWAVRDVMWHVAFWCSDAARALTDIAEGRFARAREPYGADEVNRMNDREFERSRSMPPDEVRAEVHRARAAMLERFGMLNEITADADEWFEESGPLHYAEHLRELRAWVPVHHA
ncbi:MAG TPA: maleylpyruvate isomerase N-terminal domain-containing protein [Actinomycetota bacterium]|nr:maleylpyruvate isomerase N-terminal domain-containing protein [Actinomycetota bacterium]